MKLDSNCNDDRVRDTLTHDRDADSLSTGRLILTKDFGVFLSSLQEMVGLVLLPLEWVRNPVKTVASFEYVQFLAAILHWI
jgi:hypothetical protein